MRIRKRKFDQQKYSVKLVWRKDCNACAKYEATYVGTYYNHNRNRLYLITPFGVIIIIIKSHKISKV